MKWCFGFAFVAASLALGLPAAAEDAKPSALACDVKKLGARELAECLRVASDKSDRELSEAVVLAVKSIETRAGLLSGQKTRWKRSLNDAEAQWVNWRDTECQDVAPFEAGLGAKGGDPRLSCMIDENTRRLAEIKARYP